MCSLGVDVFLGFSVDLKALKDERACMMTDKSPLISTDNHILICQPFKNFRYAYMHEALFLVILKAYDSSIYMRYLRHKPEEKSQFSSSASTKSKTSRFNQTAAVEGLMLVYIPYLYGMQWYWKLSLYIFILLQHHGYNILLALTLVSKLPKLDCVTLIFISGRVPGLFKLTESTCISTFILLIFFCYMYNILCLTYI